MHQTNGYLFLRDHAHPAGNTGLPRQALPAVLFLRTATVYAATIDLSSEFRCQGWADELSGGRFFLGGALSRTFRHWQAPARGKRPEVAKMNGRTRTWQYGSRKRPGVNARRMMRHADALQDSSGVSLLHIRAIVSQPDGLFGLQLDIAVVNCSVHYRRRI